MTDQSKEDLGKKDAIPKNANDEPKKKTIEVDAEVLQSILDSQKKQAKEIETLRTAANQNKLIEAENKSKPQELPRVFLKGFMGKIVTSWKTEASKYIYNVSGSSSAPIGEVLQARYYFEDGTDSGVVEQVQFTREDTRVWARVQEGLEGLLNPHLSELTLVLESVETADENLRKTMVLPVTPIKVRKDYLNP